MIRTKEKFLIDKVDVEIGAKHGLMQTYNKYSDDAHKRELIESIKQSEEKGDFASVEQWQFKNLMKSVKDIGGFNKLNYDGLNELDHIVKVLAGKSDKSEMAKDEVKDFISDIAKKEGSKFKDKWAKE